MNMSDKEMRSRCAGGYRLRMKTARRTAVTAGQLGVAGSGITKGLMNKRRKKGKH